MSPPIRHPERGQATTEVVLLLPLFMFFLFAFSKVFALLILVQKMEIASFYAARRWQLESHRNVQYESVFDSPVLCPDIEKKVREYIGFDDPQTRSFLGLQDATICPVTRTQVWNVVTLRVTTRPMGIKGLPQLQMPGYKFEVVKYVPNRDRPIAFVLPGLSP